MERINMIQENLQIVNEKMKTAAESAGRSLDEVKLIAVSKTKPVPMLEEAYALGCRDFGENKVQELCDKYEVLPKDIRWHLIGHLQTNKVKYIVDKAYLIHSVDSLKLAKEIQKEAEKKQVHVNILIEVNIAMEDTKFGVSVEETEELVRAISVLPNVHIKGLMTIAPIVSEPEENKIYFTKLKQLSVDIMKKNIDNICMDVLSMGMTGDYEEAIKDGATYIRVGTGIFGERDYSKL